MGPLPALLVPALVAIAGSPAAQRPAEWAQPVAAEGVPNLHRIAPGLYRSAQPTAAGMRSLEALGVHTVLSFRMHHRDRRLATGTGLRAINLPINTWDVRDAQVVAALKVLRNEAGGPYLIHCQHGADRTGLMSAMYRIVVQGWDKPRAIAEMTRGGYGFHPLWKNLLRYIEGADVEKLRRESGD